MFDTVERYMTAGVVTIDRTQSLSDAHQLMNAHAIRHLPVMDGGELVGVVSMRDLHLLETLPDVDREEATVDEAMNVEVQAVAPDASLARVAYEMAERRHGSAVVMEGGKVVGIFTTVDALRALASILDRDEAAASGRSAEVSG